MNQLAVIEPQHIQLRTLDEMTQFAAKVKASGLAPKDLDSPEAILVAMQCGMELGLPPMQAIQSIAVINKRPVVWGDTALALVKSHPQCVDVVETFERGKTDDDLLARCEVHRAGGLPPVIRTFSVAQAKKANLWGKSGPWTQYPQRMLQMRARSWALRDAFPQCLKGVGVREEVQDIPHARPANTAQPVTLQFADEPEPAQLPAPADQDGSLQPQEEDFKF